jgi:hypothetical protein
LTKFTENSAPVKRCRILLAGCLSASWLAVANAHANTITVTNTNDSGPGSLRQAIADANDGDTINTTDVSGSIELSSGELLVKKNVTINGPGAEKLSIENTHSSRVFEIASGEVVTISGLAINSGHAVAGGGIYNAGILEVTDCSISGNEAGGLRENGLGGGIFNENGATLTVINCAISGNAADQGGGIYNGGSMQIASTTLSDNFVGAVFSQQTSVGGAIYNDGTLDIADSAITGNTATGTLQRGGIGGSIFNAGTLAIANTTISGNLAGSTGAFSGAGGGIANGGGNLVIQNSTINDNTADGPSGSGFGGNIFIGEGTLEIENTILNASSGANIFNFGSQGAVISDGYNLSSDNGAGYLTAAGDQINTDPRLGPLRDNGGPTFTHALLRDSPAIDAANPNFNLNNFELPLIYDQRGLGFDRVKNGRSDIGAFEAETPRVRPTPPPTPTPSPTSTPSPTLTPTPSPTPTQSPTPPPPPSPTPTPSPSPSPSPTRSPTPTPSPAPTRSPTPAPSPTPTPSPPSSLAKIRREMRFTRTALQKLNGTTSIPPSIFTWLKVRLRVLKARLAYPQDQVLARIDRQLLNGGPMSEASRRKLVARLNARLDELRSGR